MKKIVFCTLTLALIVSNFIEASTTEKELIITNYEQEVLA